ncbi:hypothetical protein BEWA_001270 [Theileria equi strain WA]|uniref:PHD-type domain-containing protein n=1 Tax=Theileria equi strain WA TaxID=1537102 RepID=L0AYS4_THEEQ|nr:hypothetical protein BEWA_001270 [Theileria equi strain WA]AFZ80720.1 hypothetical protein BEWA_001270 [Theileria equi strain WA]|eukprot:XP_004830386.1 hypothetical protein BEWA_001270 [Theileria equi strain WA]
MGDKSANTLEEDSSSDTDRIVRNEISCYSRSCKDLLNRNELLPCTKCRKCYHAKCCDPPISYLNAARYQWFCNRCKICAGCDDNSSKRDHTMLICDACDRSFHMECTKEKYSEVPKGAWFCDDCSICQICDIKLTERESNNPTNYSLEGNKLCTVCLFKKGLAQGFTLTQNDGEDCCCVCSKSTSMAATAGDSRVTCARCKQGAHTRCSQRQIRKPVLHIYEIATWICSNCAKIHTKT